MPHPPTKSIAMLAYEGVNLIDVSGPLQAFASASRFLSDGNAAPYAMTVASAIGGLVTTAPGLPIMTESLEALATRTIDTLIIPGGIPRGAPAVRSELVAWATHHAARARRVCSVCTGAFTLAATGLLDGKRATTHWNWASQLQALYPRVHVDPEPIFIKDGPLWTSAGVTAGIDLALALIDEDLGHAVALNTARHLVMFIKRPGGQSQFSAPLASQLAADGSFTALHAWIAGHLAGDLRVEHLAEQAAMSPRTFARTYKSRMGRTPARAVEAFRLEAARHALEETETPIKRIAAQFGYPDEQALRRTFQRKLGLSPSAYRERFAATRNDTGPGQ